MWLPSPLERARDQFREDLAADPYLKYILLLSALLSTFWIWHRLPNFATRDERWRVVDSMEVAGFVSDDGLTLEALQEGTRPGYWRVFGPTLYLYGLVALPAIVLTFVVGDAHVFEAMLQGWRTDLYAHWQAIPAWLWWATILPARLVNALLAVGCVYLLYRIGTKLRDRATGRLAALLLSLTWGLIFLAHEAGEDVPALFCILLVFYLAIRYVETGSRRLFLEASAIGGLAIAFKPTAGITAVMLGVAYLLRARWADDPRRALARPGILIGGPVVALIVMYLAFPSVVLNGHEVLIDRIDRVANEKTSSHGWLGRPAWWWYIRGTVNGLGWPLAIASLGGVLAAVGSLGRRAIPPAVARLGSQSPDGGGEPSLETDGIVLALAGIAVMTGVFSTWAYFRTHHLLPLFPLAIVLVALALRWLADTERRIGPVDPHRLFQGVTAVLLLTTAIYAGVGTVGYATQPRDQAVAWLTDHGGENATVETYSWDSQEAAVPHGWTIYRPTSGTQDLGLGNWMRLIDHRCPDYVVLNYQRSMLWLAPDDHSQLADRWAEPGAASFLESLLSEESPYPYEVAKRFGPRPPFRDGGEPFDPTWNMIRAGIFPRTIQYGDPQDFGVYGYAVVLERDGSCDGSN